MPLSAAEQQRDANIQRNKELLATLGIAATRLVPAKPAPTKPKHVKKPKAQKRKNDATEDEEKPAKVPRLSELDTPTGDETSRRRSTRNSGKKVDYVSESTSLSLPATISTAADGKQRTGNSVGRRIHDPKTFGSIPGIEVGKWWPTRTACSTDAIHAPPVAGIYGNSHVGAYSVALSGGYEDDVDMGEGFTYTGSGGRDLKGTKEQPKNLRTAPQSSHQTFENPMNKALLISSETRKPVRVIRGFKSHSVFAPREGYRYDGLYIVEKAWMDQGLNSRGWKVCRYAFKRMEGQPPIPQQTSESEDEASSSDEDSSADLKTED